MKNKSLTNTTRRIAETSYRNLLFKVTEPGFWHFWLSQPRFIVLSLASVIGILALARYTYDSKQGYWVLLTLFAHGLAFWGAFVAAKALAKLEIESAIVEVVESVGSDYLSKIKARESARVDLDRLEQDLVPHNRSIPAPAMIRMFQHIFKEARDRKFESSVSLIEPYREEVLEDIFILQNYQKIALWLGIMGTFGGILLAIQAGDLANLQSKSIEEFVGVITTMFDKLVISFSASLAGLEAAIILGFFVLLLRKKQQAYFQHIESAVVTMLSIARNAINKDEFLSELGQISHGLKKVDDTIFTQLASVYQIVKSLQGQIVTQTKEIQTGIDKLPETNKKFDLFLSQAERDQRKMAEEMKVVFDSVALKTALRENIDLAASFLSKSLGVQALEISNQLAHFTRSMDALNGKVDTQVAALSEVVRGVDSQIKTQAKQTKEFNRLFDARMQDLSVNISRLGRSRESRWWPRFKGWFDGILR